MKDVLIAGDTLDFRTSVPAYPATAGYTLKYRLIPRVSGTAIVLTAATDTVDPTQYRVQVAPSTTVAWAPGEYSWAAWVEKTGARYSVDEGLSQIKADPSTIAAYDGRTQAEIALEDCRTAFATFNASGGRVKSYAIAGRSMEFDTGGDILILLSYWQAQVTREHAAKAVREGQPDPRRIQIRMSNV